MKDPTIIFTVILAVGTFIVPRKYVIVPLLIAACFVPVDQRIIIEGLDFTAVRILVLVAVLRILARGEQRVVRWGLFDKLIGAWAITSSVIYVTQWGDMRAVIYKCGFLFDVIGLYWVFRQSIRSWSDLQTTVRSLAFCMLAMTPFVLFEFMTRQNPFAMLGTVVTEERVGRFRCQGSFPISILLGLFCATVCPLLIGVAQISKKGLLYWAAAGASVFMVVASASSTPAATFLVVLGVLLLYRWRQYTSTGWLLFFLTVLVLDVIMTPPIYHLISRVNIVSGSTGWHRYYLIDQAVKHFPEWAVLGVRSTAHWGRGLSDITNEYVLQGLRGGMITLGLFTAMIAVGFRSLGRFLNRPRFQSHDVLAWALFCSFVGHCVAFFGVSYFGQISILWLLTLSCVSFIDCQI